MYHHNRPHLQAQLLEILCPVNYRSLAETHCLSGYLYSRKVKVFPGTNKCTLKDNCCHTSDLSVFLHSKIVFMVVSSSSQNCQQQLLCKYLPSFSALSGALYVAMRHDRFAACSHFFNFTSASTPQWTAVVTQDCYFNINSTESSSHNSRNKQRNGISIT